jgi:predicted peroxiredoxin
MAKFNPNKVKAFQDFLELQTKLQSAQSSYDDAKRVEQVTDAIMTMGIEAGVAAQKHYIRSRNRKRLLVGLVITGGAYLYKKMKDKEKETYAK